MMVATRRCGEPYLAALASAASLVLTSCADDGKEAALEALPGFGSVALPGRVADDSRTRSLLGAGATHLYRMTGTGLDPAGARTWFGSQLEPLGWKRDTMAGPHQLDAKNDGRWLAGVWYHGDAFFRVDWYGRGFHSRGRTLSGPVVVAVVSNAPMNPTLYPMH
jgi:hypothetical protein